MYDSELFGEDVTFGTSGFLYQNNKLMYDRQTRTLWNQLTGEPVLGPSALPFDFAQDKLRINSVEGPVEPSVVSLPNHPSPASFDKFRTNGAGALADRHTNNLMAAGAGGGATSDI